MTAAHCIDGRDLEVVGGVHNVDSNEGQRVDVINTIKHENYDDDVRKIYSRKLIFNYLSQNLTMVKINSIEKQF